MADLISAALGFGVVILVLCVVGLILYGPPWR